MYKIPETFPNGQPMDIPCGMRQSLIDEQWYLVFVNEFDADDYEESFNIKAPRYCFNGFMNAIKMSDLEEQQ